MSGASQTWRIGPGIALPLDRPRLMGILNITPDSFSDGGLNFGAGDAIGAALRMRGEGACIIDVGGESTRPGARAVDAEEQIRRVLPVVRGIRERFGADDPFISIDTTRSAVARAALDAGAQIINDVSAGRDDADMLSLAAARGCGIILMHRLAPPRDDSYSDRHAVEPDYGGDVVAAVRRFLEERCDAALRAGIKREAIVIDPGLGFGKSVAQNFELVRRTAELAGMGFPVLSAASRKSFIGKAADEPEPAKRDAASAAVSVLHWLAGVRLFRVHNVALHRQALMVAAVARGGAEWEYSGSECG